MLSTVLRVPTVAVALLLFAIPLPRAEGRSRHDSNSVLRKKEKQLKEQLDQLEKQLGERYDEDAWFAFRALVVRPELSGGVTLGRTRHHQRVYGHCYLGQTLVYRSCKVQGPRAAAELIWQAKRAPLVKQYSWRVFEGEKQADAFLKLIGP